MLVQKAELYSPNSIRVSLTRAIMALKETVFVTGFPGFIAGRLLERLAVEGARFLLLVQPHLLARARDQLQRISDRTGTPLSQFRILEGDIAQVNLAMSPEDVSTTKAESTVIYHLAAVYD